MPEQKIRGATPSKKDIKESLVAYEQLQERLVENLVELQKVHTNLAEKFDKLSYQIEMLLTLFEMSAKNFATHPANQFVDKDRDFLDKIDRLLDQNKVIAKGLTLIEENVRERVFSGHSPDLQMNALPQGFSLPQPLENRSDSPTLPPRWLLKRDWREATSRCNTAGPLRPPTLFMMLRFPVTCKRGPAAPAPPKY